METLKPYTFEERAFLIACAKFYQTETARVREELYKLEKRNTDLLFKNNKLVTKNLKLAEKAKIHKCSINFEDL